MVEADGEATPAAEDATANGEGKVTIDFSEQPGNSKRPAKGGQALKRKVSAPHALRWKPVQVQQARTDGLLSCITWR